MSSLLPSNEADSRDVTLLIAEDMNRHGFPEGRSLGEFTLTDPLDAVFLDDCRVLHGVTPIVPLDPGLKTFRDVVVLTFRRYEPGLWTGA